MFNNFSLFTKLSNCRHKVISNNSSISPIKNNFVLRRFIPISALVLIFSVPIHTVKAQISDQTTQVADIDYRKIELREQAIDLFRDIIPLDILELTNVKRKEYGLSPLTRSNVLDIAANCHAKDIAQNMNYYYEIIQSPLNQERQKVHIGSDGSSVLDRIIRSGYLQIYYGENIAIQDNATAEDAINAWMNSDIHRGNILNPNYTEIGIGYSRVDNGTGYIGNFVQVFGSPMTGDFLTFVNPYCN